MVRILLFEPRVVLNHWQLPGRGVKEPDRCSGCCVQDGWCMGKSGGRGTSWEAAAQIRLDIVAST